MGNYRDDLFGDREEKKKEAVTFSDVKCFKETPKALLCNIEGDLHWVPKSQIDDDSEVYSAEEDENEGKLIVTHWWAKETKLV